MLCFHLVGRVSADGRAYAYTYSTVATELFVVEGLR
jgi:hypothetical protein